MAEIIIAISLWCNIGSPISKETQECKKRLFQCVRQSTRCSSCWSISIPAPIYDSALEMCIEKAFSEEY